MGDIKKANTARAMMVLDRTKLSLVLNSFKVHSPGPVGGLVRLESSRIDPDDPIRPALSIGNGQGCLLNLPLH